MSDEWRLPLDLSEAPVMGDNGKRAFLVLQMKLGAPTAPMN
jgi:hypothetical protein